ncbi:glycosyltransferase family 2 protein [Christiangramia marina]|uniref:glycosyltransferase family 2 protein n=1 Tax=Christiangramia marina TaxID=409436 RepID=UPI003AA97D76
MDGDFSILITTFNRLADLRCTLTSLEKFLKDGVQIIICDDASTDGTSAFVRENYPEIKLLVNPVNKGLIYSRNRLLESTETLYAISLDDDANFLSDEVLQNAASHFANHSKCAVIACKIYWGMQPPPHICTEKETKRVQGFVGCGHIWKMEAWRNIPNYPEWFVFYGEEEFASFQLFKKGWEVNYVPRIVVHHRVEIKDRKNNKDYQQRLRRSIRSGWYLYILFYPWKVIPRRFAYTLWMQFKLKVFVGDLKAATAILQAVLDIVLNFPRLLRNSNRLNMSEFKDFKNLLKSRIYS